MLSLVHQFYAMGSDCAVHLYGGTAKDHDLIVAAVEEEIEELRRAIPATAAIANLRGSTRSPRPVALSTLTQRGRVHLPMPRLALRRVVVLFDITSGLLRRVWDFSASRLPDQSSIGAVLPFIGFDKVALVNGQLHFGQPGMELDFGGLGKEYAADRAAEVCADLGARHGFVDLGGDIRVIGPQPGRWFFRGRSRQRDLEQSGQGHRASYRALPTINGVSRWRRRAPVAGISTSAPPWLLPTQSASRLRS
jgi:thiamine biosynthesis lipoprotein